MRLSILASAFSLLVQAVFAAEWQTLAPNVMTVALGVSAMDEDTVFVTGGDNGGGATILKSTDGGSSWNPLPHDRQMMYMSIDVSKESSVGVAGVLGFYKQVAVGSCTQDGNTFDALPYVPLFSAVQSVGARGKSDLYLVGFWMSSVRDEPKDGIISSHDGGKTLNYNPWTGGTQARYGSFPTNSTWFISGGSWPADEDEPIQRGFEQINGVSAYDLNRRVRILRNEAGDVSFEIRKPKATTKSGYEAVIQKSVDNGKSFQTVFNNTGAYYLNGISCVDELACWVVGENDDGAYIINSQDGGKTWNEQTFLPGMSLIDVKMIDHREGWAVGGEILSNTFNALFVHTVDGGKTWSTANTIANAYPNAITVVNSNRAYATAFLRNGLSSILGYF